MPSHYDGSREDCRALNAYIALMRASESLTQRLSADLEAAGLTTGQFGALEALYHLGPMCQRELGEKLLRSGGNVTMVVDNLEKRALVERKRSEEDRRYITVQITAAGRKLMRDLLPRHVAEIRKQMDVLSGSDQEELRRLCKSVGKGTKS
jgi:MarR family 2-MHQ and catechol resistance regulon transcriptional repressor